MSRTELAWKEIDRVWHPFGQHVEGDTGAIERVRKSIRRLQQMRLPIAAIDEIHQLIRAVQGYDQEQECEACGERCDGVRFCKRCGMEGDTISVSDFSGLCDDCMAEDDEENEGL